MRIMIADDHPLFREALRLQVERIFADASVMDFGSLDEAVTAGKSDADGVSAELFLLDYHMPGMGEAGLRSLIETFPGIPVALVSGTANPDEVRLAIRAGAHGFIPKTASRTYMAHALQLLLAGGTSVPVEYLFPAAEPAPGPAGENASWASALTEREAQVLEGLAKGASNKEIARELILAEITVKLHVSSIFRKIGARSRSEAAIMATKANFG